MSDMGNDGLHRVQPGQQMQGRGDQVLMAKNLTDWAREPSVKDLQEDLFSARDAHSAHKVKIKHWNDLRDVTGSAKPKKITGRSSVQPRTIRKTAEWRYSALSEPFLSTPKLVKVKPHTHRDGAAARQNEIVLNWQFRTKINKTKFIDEYVRTAVDEGTVIVRLGWERHTRQVPVEVPVFQYVMTEDPEYLQLLQEAIQIKAEDPAAAADMDPAMAAAVEYYEESGMAIEAIQVGTEQVMEEEVLENRPTLQIVDPENIYIDPACQGDLDKANFVIASFETTKAELKKDGRYKNLDVVNWSANSVLSAPDHATTTPGDYASRDDLRKPVVAYESWCMWDIDGSENLVPVVCTWIGDIMIRCEMNPFPDEKPPFVMASYMPVKRSVWGEPDAELLEDNQAILGAVTRGMIDLMGRSANSQQGMAKGFLDVTNRKRFHEGKDYEFNPGAGDPRLSVYQHSYPEIPNSAITMVNMQNHEAESLSGVKAFAGGLSGEAYGDVAAGIKGMIDAAGMREMGILRRLADGIKIIGEKISAMNGLFFSEEETVQVTDEEFVTVTREELKGKFDMEVDISTAEIDERKAQDLAFMLQTMGPNMDPKMSYEIQAEIAELKRMPVLAYKLRTYEPKPDPVQQKMQELELAKLEAEIAKLQSETEENRAQAMKYKAEADKAELEFVGEESGIKHQRDLEKQSQQARAHQDLEITKSLLKPRKPEERAPDIDGAIGWNALTEGQGVL